MDDYEREAMFRHDDRHWWFRGRRQVVRAALERELSVPPKRLLDAGCGSGRTLDDLAQLGSVAGIDLAPEAVAAARQRGHRDVHVAPVERMPFEDGAFDVVTCLDVIEHTPNDRVSLRELRRVTRPGGLLVVTVPAHPGLWSQHDVVNRHFRRYRRKDLIIAAREAGWEIECETYFNSLTLGPAAAVRQLRRLQRAAPARRSDLERTPDSLNALLALPLLAEAKAIRAGRRIPFGLSLLAVLSRRQRSRSSSRAGRPSAPGVAARATPIVTSSR